MMGIALLVLVSLAVGVQLGRMWAYAIVNSMVDPWAGGQGSVDSTTPDEIKRRLSKW